MKKLKILFLGCMAISISACEKAEIEKQTTEIKTVETS